MAGRGPAPQNLRESGPLGHYIQGSVRFAILTAACALAAAQTPDPAYEPLARAYVALQARDYDAAVAGFTRAIELAPQRASIRKDLAYTFLKIGENDLARDQFHAAMTIDPADVQVAHVTLGADSSSMPC